MSAAGGWCNRLTLRARASNRRALFVAGLVAIGVHLLSSDVHLDEWSYLVITVGAAVVAVLGVRGFGPFSVRGLVAAGLALSAIADAIWQVFVWTDRTPEVSVADAFWLSSYVAIGGALVGTVRQRGRGSARGFDRDGIIDVMVVALLAMIVQWELSLGTLVTDGSIPVVHRLVWALYPACDAVLLALVVRATVSGRVRGVAGWTIAAGAACWLFADFAFSVFLFDDSAVPWMNAGWLLGAMLLAVAVHTVPSAVDTYREPVAERTRYGEILVAIVPLLVPGAVAMLQQWRGEQSNASLLYAATLTLIGLTIVRADRLLRAEKAARHALRAQERFAHSVAMNSADAVMVLDVNGLIARDSPTLASLVGSEDGTVGRDVFEFVAPVDQDMLRAALDRCLASAGSTGEAEIRVATQRSGTRWLGVRLVNMIEDVDVRGVVVNLHDISDRKRAEQELAHQAFHDALTQLANRALFTDRVDQALRRHARASHDVAVIFLDLDGFKTVNDGLGHGAGDALLVEVAQRLRQAVRSVDTVARLGGDEFAILIEQTRDPIGEAQSIAERVLRSFDDPIAVAGQAVTVSASIGIAVTGHEQPATSGSLLRDADVAMYRAKANGKGRWVVYDSTMHTASIERLRLESALGGALAAGQLSLVYQPIVELSSERVVGFEALLRWHHPTLGSVAPDTFIPVAESTGQIVAIGRWVLEEACRTAMRWRRMDSSLARLTIAVNISARQLTCPDITDQVATALANTGLEPEALVLEMTETALIHDTSLAADRLGELSALGVRLAIDDFGTGYSSLSYLRHFPVDILKIDRSFIDTIQHDEALPAIVRGLLDLGRTLDLELVAEGVELGIQRDQLRRQHCDYAQGYLFSHPLEPIDAEHLLVTLSAVTQPPRN